MPFFTAIGYSFSYATVGNTSFSYAGLRNFRNVWNAPDFHAALRNTFVFTLIAQFFVLILANMLALIRRRRCRRTAGCAAGCGARACC